MEIKKIEPIQVVSRSIRTTLKELSKNVGNIPNEIQNEIETAKAEITGAPIWIYTFEDFDMEKEFTLEIAYPVNKEIKTKNKSVCKLLPEFRCLADYNNGPWDQVGKVYEKMMQEVEEKKYQPTFVSREVYLQCDFINQENCVTEVQFGIN